MVSSAALCLYLLIAAPQVGNLPAPNAKTTADRGLRIAAPRLISLDLPAERAAFALTLSTPEGPLTLDLQPTTLRSDTFRLIADDGHEMKAVPSPPPGTWRGTAYRPGRGSGVVAATLHGGRLNAVIRLDDGALLTIQPASNLPDGSDRRTHVIYTEDEISAGPETCGTTELGQAPKTAAAESFGTVKIAEIAIEADTFFYQAMGSSVPATLLDIETVLNAVSVIYEGEVGITYELTALVVQTGNKDEYSGNKHQKLLTQFRARWNDDFDDIDRDLAHLMTGRQIETNVVGLAFVGVVCDESFAYGFSESTFTTNLAVRTALTAHEIGHNWNANHCNGAPDCSIMCSTLGQCSLNIVSFGVSEENQILGYKNSISCVKKLPTPTIAPFLDTFADSKLNNKNWSAEGGTKVSSKASAEPSGSRAVNLDAKNNGLPDVLYSRGFDVTAMADPALAFFAEHQGVPATGTLSVEYQSASGVWFSLGDVMSDGIDQYTFASVLFPLPFAAEHGCVRFRFRAEVDGKKEEWFIDDVRVIEDPGVAASALLDPAGVSALRFEFAVGSMTPAQDTVDIRNTGAAGASLVWTASAIEGAMFVAPTPTSGTVTSIEVQDVLTITADPTGLAPGIHPATVRVQNSVVPADFLDVPITIIVYDDTPFVPGDLLVGSVDNPGDTEVGTFLAIEGAKVKLKFATTAGDLLPVIVLRGEDGEIIEKIKVSGGSGTVKVVLPRTEVVRLEVTGKKSSTGAFEIETSLSLPDSSTLHSTKAKPASAGADVDLFFSIPTELRGHLTISPANDDGGPYVAELFSPSGQSRGLLPSQELLPTGGLILRDVAFPPGTHTLRLSGFTAKEKLVVTFDPASSFVPGSSTVNL